ncbi:hypothetical protein [Bradyrhizobium sp. USDA 336]|uniref:hypothetical protein n=1 Tax=Bradyrhizobium sp. USDA 336 TaxID=3156311 RepID=UPI00384BD6A8
MVLHVTGSFIALALHPLDRKGLDACIDLDQTLHFGHQRLSRIRRRLRVLGQQQAELEDGMDRAHADPRRRVAVGQVRRVDPERPIAGGKAPTVRMIPAHIAEQAGAPFHALHELFRQTAHLFVGQASLTQSLDRECDVGDDLPRRQNVGFGSHLEDVEKRGKCGRIGELQQQQAAVI